MKYKIEHLKKMRKALQEQILDLVGKRNNTPLKPMLIQELIVIEELLFRYETKLE